MPTPLSPLAKSDLAHLLHPYTNLARHAETGPLVIVRGEGVRVYDSRASDYIEALAGLWCTALGCGNERLAKVAAAQMRSCRSTICSASKAHDPAIRLAEKLAEIAPGADARVFFANSGSEANDTAIKLVWYLNNALGRPAKKKIIGRDQGLSRRHRGHRLADRAGRPTTALSTCRCRASCTPPARITSATAGRRERGAVRHPPRRRAGAS